MHGRKYRGRRITRYVDEEGREYTPLLHNVHTKDDGAGWIYMVILGIVIAVGTVPALIDAFNDVP